MFQVLVAQNLNGSFQKIAVIKPRRDGSFAVPEKMHGQLSATVTRNAIRFFMAEPAATSQDVEIGSQSFRVSRF